MSLYGNDDSNANKTKAGIGLAGSSQAKLLSSLMTQKHNSSPIRTEDSTHLAGGRILHTPISMVTHAIRQSNLFTLLNQKLTHKRHNLTIQSEQTF